MNTAIEGHAQGVFVSAATGLGLGPELEPPLPVLLAAPLPSNARLIRRGRALWLRATLSHAAATPGRRAGLAAALEACAARLREAPRAHGSWPHAGPLPGGLDAPPARAASLLEGLRLLAEGSGWSATAVREGLDLEPADGERLRVAARPVGRGLLLAAASGPGLALADAASRAPLRAALPHAVLDLNGSLVFARLRLVDAAASELRAECSVEAEDEEELGLALEAVSHAARAAGRVLHCLQHPAVALEYAIARRLDPAPVRDREETHEPRRNP